MFFSTAEPASGVPQVLQSQRSPISDPISADPICTGVARRGAPRAVSVIPRSGKFLGFITLTIVFLIQNYRAFVRGRLAKIRISSPEFLIFGRLAAVSAAGENFANSDPFGALGAASAALCAKRESEENFRDFEGNSTILALDVVDVEASGVDVDVRPSGPGGCGCAGSRGRSQLDVYGPRVTPATAS